MTNINPVKPNMDYVEKLLKGRKGGAELELSLADANNPIYSESIANRKDEISQIDIALLVLYPVGKCSRCKGKTDKPTISYCDECIMQDDYS